ncbi:MAG: NB-ARC domain-containing protein [Deltaproteobacteria bacterium]|nr:NB-ARC domain-containing protein [Deltaproteobacteria bacterium]
MSKIFISYARDDKDEDFIKNLCTWLDKEGHHVWWDRESMPSRALQFTEEIRLAIEEVDRLFLIFGPAVLESKYVRDEIDYAFHQKCKVVTTILRKGKMDDLPEELRRAHVLDFTETSQLEHAWKQIKKTLKKPVVIGFNETPKLPEHYWPRSEDLAWLKSALLPDRIALKSKIAFISGMGGMGKSVLAASFAKSCEVRWAFFHGIKLIKLDNLGEGKKPDEILIKALQQAALAFGDKITEKYSDLDGAKTSLRQYLEKKASLIILDNVWDTAQVNTFVNTLGSECGLLVTTRNEAVAVGFEDRLHQLRVLSENSAIQLLADWCNSTMEEMPREARSVAKACGYLPFALSLCGAMASGRRPVAWTSLLEALQEADLTYIQSQLPDYSEYQNVYQCLEVSFKTLESEDNRIKYSRCYLDMAVFPGGEPLPESVITMLWLISDHSKNLKTRDFDLIFQKLVSRSLLQFYRDTPPYQYSLHDLQRDHLLAKIKNDHLLSLHENLGGALLEWWKENKLIYNKENEDKQKYIMNNLFSHLVQAGSWNDLRNLIADVEYLKKQQSPERQYGFEQEFKTFLEKENLEVIREILNALLETLKKMKNGKTKADWLDTFAYWITVVCENDESKADRTLTLKEIAANFDKACGEVSQKLSDSYLKKGDRGWALRFAELRTWVYQRAGEYEMCAEACRDAEKQCRKVEMEDAYRYLAGAEFLRVRAQSLNKLSKSLSAGAKKEKNIEAYNELKDHISEYSPGGWNPTIKEWQLLEKVAEEDLDKVLVTPSMKKKEKYKAFKALVVSNEHDCISAIHIVSFFEQSNGFVEWIHHKNFKEEDFACEDTLFTVLIGGPKSPGISSVAEEFYEVDKKGFLRMYSGLYFEASCIEIEKNNSHCYMLGGISKVNTLMAAYNFTKSEEVAKIIREKS